MLGAYIHIPFCKKICNYCDFCKMLYFPKYIDKYLDELAKEIVDRYKGEELDSIYIGGGTPSSLSTEELDKLLSIISILKLKDKYEYTIECNIEDITIDKINLFMSYGINRISFGVQSFDDNNAKKMGREHNEDMVFDNIYLTKKYFNNINIDLIYGVNENIDVVKNDIRKFLELDIPHISCYSLILEEHTIFYINKFKSINEDIDSEMYSYISQTLVSHGYNHYEISNYARPGYESIHNKNYWLNGSYYGFGLGAVSYLDNYRISNTKNMTKYLKGEYQSKKDYEDVKTRKETDLMLGLRLSEGIDIDTFNNKYHTSLLEKDAIRELIDDNYLEVVDNHLRCNDKYLYTENSILTRIIDSDL